MKIHNRNAEILLYEKVRSLAHEYHDNWRCIYLGLSGRRERHNQSLRHYFIINAISGMLAQTEGYIYLCGDGDIFVLFQGALSPIVNKLSTHFADLAPKAQAQQHEDGPFIIFDLSKQWLDFSQLCEAKHRQLGAALEKKRMHFAHYEHNAARPSQSVQ